MHNGWKKICRSVCRKMDVFVQRRRLCNLITSVASVADSGIICSYSVSITWVNFVALPAARDGDLGRGGEILAQLLTRGLPLAGCLLRAAGGVSPGQGVHGGGGGGCRGAGSATPGERLPKSPCKAAQWSHWAASAARSSARSHRNLGLGCMATAERRRNKTEIKIDPPPPPLPSPSPASKHGVVLTSFPVLKAELVPLRPGVCGAQHRQRCVSLGVSSDCSQLWQGAASVCYDTAWLTWEKSIVRYNSFVHLLHLQEPKRWSISTFQAS